jgi:hypothetical protein
VQVNFEGEGKGRAAEAEGGEIWFFQEIDSCFDGLHKKYAIFCTSIGRGEDHLHASVMAREFPVWRNPASAGTASAKSPFLAPNIRPCR